jgi:hypothetical protein
MGRGRPVTRAATVAGYVCIVGAMVVADVVARRRDRATLVDALGIVCANRVGKWIVLAGWLWLGWHVFVRVGDR